MTIRSSAFSENESIPKKYSCDGENVSPPLELKELPRNTESLVLICDDPDAPGKTFLHWLAYDIEPTGSIAEDQSVGTEGKNDFGKNGYGGPCPPGGTHRYYFRVYALDAKLGIKPGASRSDVESAMSGHVLDQAELMGRYARQ
jgi:hypothetical protein